MTRRQSKNQLIGGITDHPSPKIHVKKFAGKVLASIFWDQDDILLIDISSKGQPINVEYYSSQLVQTEGNFEGKMPQEFHQECIVFAGQCPGSAGTSNPEETDLPGLPVS
jgi:hypothetical protein